MRQFAFAALVFAGLVNLYPLIGVVSAAQLERLYGVSLQDVDLILLLRHRAVLFGLLGALIVASAFRPTLRPLAIVGGLVSMLAFVVLAWTVGDHGASLRKVVVADLVASTALCGVAWVERATARRPH